MTKNHGIGRTFLALTESSLTITNHFAPKLSWQKRATNFMILGHLPRQWIFIILFVVSKGNTYRSRSTPPNEVCFGKTITFSISNLSTLLKYSTPCTAGQQRCLFQLLALSPETLNSGCEG